jgi:hypothetical protein
MSTINNSQLKVIIGVPSAILRATKINDGLELLVSANGSTFHQLENMRGKVRVFKTFDAMINHVSYIADGEAFSIEFGGAI